MILDVKNLCIDVRKPEKKIIKNFSFSLEEGKIFVLLGESGSGKSMMIKALVGIINQKNMNVTGEILLGDVDLLSLKERERRMYSDEIALIMQNPMTAFNPSMKLGKQMLIKAKKIKSWEKNLL